MWQIELWHIKGEWVYFGGKQPFHILFVSLLNGIQLLKERICSCRSKCLPLRADSLLEEFPHSKKQTGSYYKSFLHMKKWQQNWGMYPMTLYPMTLMTLRPYAITIQKIKNDISILFQTDLCTLLIPSHADDEG